MQYKMTREAFDVTEFALRQNLDFVAMATQLTVALHTFKISIFCIFLFFKCKLV